MADTDRLREAARQIGGSGTELSRELLARVGQHLHALGLAGPPPPQPSGAGPLGLDAAAEALGVTRARVVQGLAGLARMPFVDLRQISPAPEAIASFPEVLARRYRTLPLFLNGPEITLAVGNPRSWNELDELSARLPGREIIFVLADEAELGPLIELCWPTSTSEAVALHLRAVLEGADPSEALQALGAQAPVIEMVEAVLRRALNMEASDIHLEPFETFVQVRFRVDGQLRLVFRYEPGVHEAMIARLKILSDLNIMDRMRPQDGRFTFVDAGRRVDARLSLLRMADGEKAVVRLLRGSLGALRTLDDLGMTEDVRGSLRRILAQPHGIFLVTGPTGSGKSSTLYAALQALNEGARNLITLEDPVEYRLPGANQVPVRPDHDLTFAVALRSVLRQDPDVVMVGEIRDQETAEIAIRGALTGHLMLSSLHTNDAVETITRLREMGVAASNLAPALLGVLAQRLVRRLCGCHGYEAADAERLADLGLGFLPPGTPLPAARGCIACDGQGFRGRAVIFELLVATAEIKQLILTGGSSAELTAAARRAGLRPMAWAGMRAMLGGLTTPEEVLRATPRPL